MNTELDLIFNAPGLLGKDRDATLWACVFNMMGRRGRAHCNVLMDIQSLRILRTGIAYSVQWNLNPNVVIGVGKIYNGVWHAWRLQLGTRNTTCFALAQTLKKDAVRSNDLDIQEAETPTSDRQLHRHGFSHSEKEP